MSAAADEGGRLAALVKRKGMEMRSRRLIKKLSKKLAQFYKDAWQCADSEEIYYRGDLLDGTSAKGIYHVGGGTDYWGEGEEAYTVLEMAEMNFFWWQSFCGCEICQDSFDPLCTDKCEVVEKRLAIRPTFRAMRAVLADGA